MNRNRIKNVIWGIVLILIAVGIVVQKLDIIEIMIFPNLSLWQVIFGLIFAYTLIDSLAHMSFGGILFSIAFLCIVFQHQLHVEKLVPGTVLLVAIIGTMALHLIFGGSRKHYNKHNGHKGSRSHMRSYGHGGMKIEQEETVEADVVKETVSFCGATKYIHSDNFQGAELNCSFCGADFYFDKVNVPSGEATITINNRYGGVQIYVPDNWIIRNDVNSFCGSVDIDDRNINEGSVVVFLNGENRFGGVEVIRA